MGLSLFQFCGLWIEVKSLWDQWSESLDPVGFFRFAKVRLLPMDLFDHKHRKILQGVAFKVEVTSHWLFQMSMLNIWSMAVHSYVECILCFSNILFFTFYTLDHVHHVSRRTVGRGFYWICFPGDRALESLYRLDVLTGLTMNLLALRIPLVW